MKKIYLLGLILGTSSLVFAQHSTSALKKVTKEFKPSKQTITHTTKALGQEVWSDDFSDPSTWDIDNDGSSTAGEGWNINSTDRKSTRLNSSHVRISYAVFCLKKKKK